MPMWPFHTISRNVMMQYGKLRYCPGDYQLDPDRYHAGIPMSLPGDRVWQGVQKDNRIDGLLPGANPLSGSRNSYQTNLERTQRIEKNNAANLGQKSMGPATFAQLMGIG